MTSMFPAPTTSPQRLESGTGPGETTLGRFVAENPLWQFMGPIILNISDLKVQVVGKLLVVPWPAI